MNQEGPIQRFKEKLDSQHSFPGKYIFKFIVPIEQKNEVLKILPNGEVYFKSSKKENYISITSVAKMESSDNVIKIYENAYQIKGIISL